jgi:hypothetical protein
MADWFWLDIMQTISQIFSVPAEWFESPVWLIYLVLPVVMSTTVFYLLLSRKLHVFRNGAVNIVLAICLAFFAIPLAIAPAPLIAIFFSTFASVLGILSSMYDRITGWNLLISLVAAVMAYAAATYGVYLISLYAIY